MHLKILCLAKGVNEITIFLYLKHLRTGLKMKFTCLHTIQVLKVCTTSLKSIVRTEGDNILQKIILNDILS